MTAASERAAYLEAIHSEQHPDYPMFVAPQIVGCTHGVRCWRHGEWWVYQHGENPEARWAIRRPANLLDDEEYNDKLRQLGEWVDRIHEYEYAAHPSGGASPGGREER